MEAVDDTTMSESIVKGGVRYFQNDVDEFVWQALVNKFQLNERKCKELRIGFGKETPRFDPIQINGGLVEVVIDAKILGLHISNNLKWNKHIDEIIKKVRKRLYFFSQLKRSKVGVNELVQFYITCIRPIIEYACQAFHNGLTQYLSYDLEMIQKRAMKIIFPWIPYDEALGVAGLQ